MAANNDRLRRDCARLAARYRVTGGRFRLKDVDPGDTAHLGSNGKEAANGALKDGVAALAGLQDRLYAHNHYALLLIFQAMDAAGKDGVIKHVMSGVNPQGCQVAAFKAPSAEELDHDYLWRCSRHLPERGRIGIFNRSYYEEVLVVRVHPEFLAGHRLPPERITPDIWQRRYAGIRGFEQHLTDSGTVVRKFFLHVSRAEQKRRFLERIDQPDKNWKFNAGDVAERAHWPRYMRAYEDMIRATATRDSPWYVVPADNKWFTRMVVAAVIVDTLAKLDLHYPRLTATQRRELAVARRQLLAEAGRG